MSGGVESLYKNFGILADAEEGDIPQVVWMGYHKFAAVIDRAVGSKFEVGRLLTPFLVYFSTL